MPGCARFPGCVRRRRRCESYRSGWQRLASPLRRKLPQYSSRSIVDSRIDLPELLIPAVEENQWATLPVIGRVHMDQHDSMIPGHDDFANGSLDVCQRAINQRDILSVRSPVKGTETILRGSSERPGNVLLMFG